jgi:hypothetical protein
MIPAKEIDGELWIKASDHHQAIKEALAQPVQEPVAWMTINEYGEEDDIHYENPKNHLMEGWTYKPLYTHPPQPAPMAQPELNAAIVQTLLPKLYSIIDRLLDGQEKALVIEARRMLPKAYKNSFETKIKEKA